MKLFSDMSFPFKIKNLWLLSASLFLNYSCATHDVQLGKNVKMPETANASDTAKIAHTFYLVGDAGNADEPQSQKTLSLLHERLNQASKNSTLLFLGDNIYPVGFASKKDSLSQLKLINQLELTKGFKGNTVFIPGNHDWYSGMKGLERQADFVTDYLKDKKSFLPRKNCAIDDEKINDLTTLVTIDSQWFLEDWDNHPIINDDCEIKTREHFFDELESILKKNQDKTVIIAIHHPLLSNGTHGGQFSVEKQLYPLEKKIPLPIIGSLINLLRKTSGASPQDLQNKVYTTYAKRIKTLIEGEKNIIVVSGHDHNLQFIKKENINQIISGAGSKSEAAKAVNPNDFSYGKNGYASLNLYENGAAKVKFYGNENNQEKLLFEHTVIPAVEKSSPHNFPTSFPEKTKAAIYSEKMTKKSWVHRVLFGKHYRSYYSLAVEVPTATIDTLFGGLTPVRAGGGHQSKSLRVADAQGHEYVLRALKKSATQFLQSVAFKDQYIVNDFEDTYAEGFLFDFYTTSHPYTPFIVGDMAVKIGVTHTNPLLYYIPKQKGLLGFNEDFGDELYMVEERADDNQIGVKSFGTPRDIISTSDMMKNLRKDEKYSVDEPDYIKARLFDMLIGDWDRHDDQWRWGEYEQNGKVIYKPIPRDRDQAFSKYDGAAFWIIMNIPDLRHMRTFGKEIDNVKWLNREPYPQDIAFLKTATEEEWLKQAKYIQENLTDADINSAFDALPKELQDKTTASIKKDLISRRNELQKYAATYYGVLQHTVLITGTDKKDKFIINHTNKHQVELTVIRLKKDGEELQYTKTFTDKKTKQLWIYGLDDDDVYEVIGNQKSSINIKLIGGQNNDSYVVKNGKKIKIYDFKSKKNTFDLDSKATLKLTDDYDINLYNYEKPKYNAFSATPTIGYNPDDNVKMGFNLGYKVNGFKQRPYTQKHLFKANYYFGTQGVELTYDADFPEVIGGWGFAISSQFTTPNFTINFFGYGNETQNQDEEFGMNYNRVRIQKLKVAPSIFKVGRYGSEFSFQTRFEQYEVEDTNNRYINTPGIVSPIVFQNQQFAGAKIKYSFINADFLTLPTMGINFMIAGTWTANLHDSKRNFPSLESSLGFSHKLDANGKVVLATNFKVKAIFNNNYEFYQGAVLGGDSDLRGFRNERFLGNTYYAQSTDLRWNLGKIRKSIIPLSYGILGGYDYGKVWLEDTTSNKWHHNYGGGLWINAVNFLTARVTYFKAPDETARVSFGVGFNF